MNVPNAGPQDDPWLTLGEIAEELRVNPATVRLWVSKGQLEATRAGMRKWIVRRSEVDRMLACRPSAPKNSACTRADAASRLLRISRAGGPDRAGAPRRHRTAAREAAWQLVELSSREVEGGGQGQQSRAASAGYPDRLRAIADGLEHSASTIFPRRRERPTRWAGRGWLGRGLSCRTRSGRAGTALRAKGLWDRFDEAFTVLIAAGEGTDTRAVAQAHRDAGDALLEVANQLADEETLPADSRMSLLAVANQLIDRDARVDSSVG